MEPKKTSSLGPFLGVLALISAGIGATYISEPEVKDELQIGITGDTDVKVGKLVKLQAEGDAVTWLWFTFPEISDKDLYKGCENKDLVFSAGAVSSYSVTLVGTGPNGEATYRRHVIKVTDGPAPPVVPPGPVVPPVVPPVPVVTDQPFQITIIHESNDDTPEQARLWLNLRQGPAADYLKTKGHQLTILDDDEKDGKGTPTPLVSKWAPFTEGFPTVIISGKSGQLIHRYKLPAGDKADLVLDEIKKRGG